MARGERAEALSRAVLERIEGDVTAALRRRPPAESKLAGVLRALAPVSATVRNVLAETATVLARRGSFDRELWSASIRALAEAGDKRAAPLLKTALADESAGGFATLSAACFARDPSLATSLGKLAASRHAHLAFAAEVARLARGESNGALLVALAPKIKESHRIAMCVELFVPLTRSAPVPRAVAAPLAVLRDAERHLGRWLVLAEVATRAGDPGPLAEARERSADGPSSARAAWSLVGWALEGGAAHPATRPTVELVARLSDRPSADRDTTFLFRMAGARVPSARPMLETLAKSTPLGDEVAVRAAMHLSRDHARTDLRAAIEEAAAQTKREELRGVAAAALWDLGATEAARHMAESLEGSRVLTSVAWSALVSAAAAEKAALPLLSEPTFRRVQWGWVE